MHVLYVLKGKSDWGKVKILYLSIVQWYAPSPPTACQISGGVAK